MPSAGPRPPEPALLHPWALRGFPQPEAGACAQSARSSPEHTVSPFSVSSLVRGRWSWPPRLPMAPGVPRWLTVLTPQPSWAEEGPRAARTGRLIWGGFCCVCLEHRALPVPWERGSGSRGAVGKEGLSFLCAGGAQGYQGAARRLLPLPQRHLCDPVSAFVRGLQKWGAGGLPSQGPGAWGDGLARGAQRESWADAAEPKPLCHRGRGSCCRGDGCVSHAPLGLRQAACRGLGPCGGSGGRMALQGRLHPLPLGHGIRDPTLPLRPGPAHLWGGPSSLPALLRPGPSAPLWVGGPQSTCFAGGLRCSHFTVRGTPSNGRGCSPQQAGAGEPPGDLP